MPEPDRIAMLEADVESCAMRINAIEQPLKGSIPYRLTGLEQEVERMQQSVAQAEAHAVGAKELVETHEARLAALEKKLAPAGQEGRCAGRMAFRAVRRRRGRGQARG